MQNDSFNRPDTNRRLSLCVTACVVILAVAAALRIRGALNDLWFDEIWSLHLADGISSPVEVFTKIHHDNNHYLNTLCLYFFGQRDNWPGYRIPSLVTGVGTVVLAGLIGRRRNAASAFLAMLLTGFSYVLVLYSSEARGYGPAVFFAFVSYYLMDGYLEKQKWQTALMFSFSVILGFMSQLTFLCFFSAAFIWSGYRLIKSRLGFKRAVMALLSCYAMPCVFLAVIYFVDIRRMAAGGGTYLPVGEKSVSHLLTGYGTALAWALGTPSGGFITLLFGIISSVFFAVGIKALWSEKSDSIVFFIGVILAFPILLVAIRPVFYGLYVRFFIISIAFFLILLSFVLESLWHRGRLGKACCLLLLTVYLVMNGLHTMSLFKDGRGHYGEAVHFLIEHSKGPQIIIGGDHDFRIPPLLEFYCRGVGGGKQLIYDKQALWPPEGPEWIICHNDSFKGSMSPGTQITDPAGNQYELVKTFPTAPLSGFYWFIYHNRTKCGNQ